MKTFNTPYVEVVKFAISDVVTASPSAEEEEMIYDPPCI